MNKRISTFYIILERHNISTEVSEQIPLFQLIVECPVPCLPNLGSFIFLLSWFFCAMSSLPPWQSMVPSAECSPAANAAISCLPSAVLEMVQECAFPKVSPFPPKPSQIQKYLSNWVGTDIVRISTVRVPEGHSYIWMLRPEVTCMTESPLLRMD